MSEQEETKKDEVAATVDAPSTESKEPAKTEASTTEADTEADSKDTKEKDAPKPSEGKRVYSQDERRKHKDELRRTYKTSSHNVRTDFDALPETDDPDEIRKQVEFYFSDSNLAYDDHMRSRVLGNRDNVYGENHAVPIKDIHSFKRMRRFQPYSAVVEALKGSSTLDVVGEGGDEIRRKNPLEKPKENEAEFGDPSIPRSIYAKGFPEEGRTTQFDIEAFFTPYGPLNSVRLRRSFPERLFKGSVFVEFETEELQQEFLAIENKPKFEGHELLIKSKRQYCDEKMEDVKNGKIQSNKRHLNFKGYLVNDSRSHSSNDRSHHSRGNRGKRSNRGGGNHRGGRDRRDRERNDDANGEDGGDKNKDKDDWRSRRDAFQKNGGGGATPATPAATEAGAEKETEKENGSKKRARDADGDGNGNGNGKKIKGDV